MLYGGIGTVVPIPGRVRLVGRYIARCCNYAYKLYDIISSPGDVSLQTSANQIMFPRFVLARRAAFHQPNQVRRVLDRLDVASEADEAEHKLVPAKICPICLEDFKEGFPAPDGPPEQHSSVEDGLPPAPIALLPRDAKEAIEAPTPRLMTVERRALVDAWCRDAKVRVLPCGHLFHVECLETWLQQNNSCPLCRASPDDHSAPYDGSSPDVDDRFHSQRPPGKPSSSRSRGGLGYSEPIWYIPRRRYIHRLREVYRRVDLVDS